VVPTGCGGNAASFSGAGDALLSRRDFEFRAGEVLSLVRGIVLRTTLFQGS
jgi:hypothetical protein